MATDDSTLSAFGDFIRAQRRLARISQRNLAKATGLSDSYLSQLERGVYRPSAQAAKALADAFGLSPQTLYTQLGLLDAEATHTPGVEDAIRNDNRLRPDQKEALLLMYRTLVVQDAAAD
ncbi:MAG: helix-turn-helix domain-containing protein [Actinomycetes bacterium]